MAAHTSEENAGDFTREALLGSAAGMTAIEDRIMLIHDIMLSGQWITRVTDRFLAQAWGMTRNRVHQMSCEASRMVRREIGADEVSQRKNMALGYLDMIKAFAVTGKKELLAGIAATKLEGQIVGFVVNRHEIKADTNPYKDYTLEELEHFGVTGETPARLSKEDE